MALFTFVLDYRGGTYCDQAEGDEPSAAVKRWAETTSLDAIAGLTENSRAPFRQQMSSLRPSEIPGTCNVWCISGIARGHLALVHIVKTAS